MVKVTNLDTNATDYLARLTTALQECLRSDSKKYGLLIVADGEMDVMSLYSINAVEEMLPAILTAAAQVVFAQTNQEQPRVFN
jgi:hypothetical protein